MTMRQYLTDRGYCVPNGEHIDIVNRILATMEVDAIMEAGATMEADATTGPAKEAEGDSIAAPDFEEV